MSHIFCKIEGIKGESKDDKHKDWIEILSFNHSVNQPISAASRTGGRTAGRAEFQDLVIKKVIDKATPELYLHCSNGKHIPKAELEFVMESGKKHTFMKYEIKDIIVSSVTPTGDNTGDDVRPHENVAMSYGSISWEYTPIDEKGSPGAALKRGWDLRTNKQL